MATYKITLLSDCEFWGEGSRLCTNCTASCTAKDEVWNRVFSNKREATSFFKRMQKKGFQVKFEKV